MKVYLSVLLLLLCSLSHAEIYMYVDESGKKIFTDQPPKSTSLADKKLREQEAKQHSIACTGLREELEIKRRHRSESEGNTSREFYYDSQIRTLKEQIATSCET